MTCVQETSLKAGIKETDNTSNSGKNDFAFAWKIAIYSIYQI